jgi:hypothetical protein
MKKMSSFIFKEKRQSFKSADQQQMMFESNKRSANHHEQRQPLSEDKLDDINAVPNTDSHWVRLLARLNGNWLQ